MADTYILGIESSCDETAAAVVRSGEQVVSNVVSSQVKVHAPYGGVVPELASREHLRNIVPVVREALEKAGKTYESVDALAVTRGPGLAGALMVGVSFAKAIGYATGKPLIAVNHLEGHIHAVLLEHRQSHPFRSKVGSQADAAPGAGEIEFPVLALVVSGGHTHLYLAEAYAEGGAQPRAAVPHWTYRNIGRTRDDAAGEAFDKVAKLLGLGYPGGPVIDRLAKHGDARAVKFPPSQIKGKDRAVREGRAAQTEFDFSFSGIKTAVLRYVETHGMKPRIEERQRKLGDSRNFEDVLAACDRETLDLVASFQRTVVRDLVEKTLDAVLACEVRSLFVTGGVAANSELRETFEREAAQQGLPVYFPSRPLSTDNAAMIAAAAYPKWLAKEFASADLSAEAGLQLR